MSVLTFSARLSVEGGRWRRGRLSLSSGTLRWRSWLRRATDLTGAAVLRAAMRQVRHRRGAVEVELRLTDGRSARLLMSEAEAAATVHVLTGRAAPGLDPTRIRPSGPTWWAVACLTLAALWVAFMVILAFDGYTATATVVRSSDTWTCAVTWQSPSGTPEHDDTDCFGEPPRSSFQVVVPYGDYEGAVTTRPTLALVGVIGAVPLATIGVLRVRVVSRRRRTNVDLLRLAAGAGTSLGDPATSVDRTAAALRQARRRAWAVAAVGTICVGATVTLGMIMDEADSELRATGITTVGTVVDVYPDSRYSSGGLDVRFAVGGASATRHLSVGGYAEDYAEGQQVVVLYDRLAPDRFTVDDVSYEPPWTFWPMMVAVFGALLAAPTGIWMVLSTRRTRRILTEGSWEPVRIRVQVDDGSSWFITDGGRSWRSWSDRRWGGPRIDLRRLRDLWLSRPDPTGGIAGPDVGGEEDFGSGDEAHGEAEESPIQDAWWVRQGERAVFSPDKGNPLVLARLL